MNIEEAWGKALQNTEIVRARISGLLTVSETKIPYILLSESAFDHSDTVVRKGEVIVERPALLIPPLNPQLYGFDFDSEKNFNEDTLINFLIVRGISLPSLRYDNCSNTLDVFEGKLSDAIKHYNDSLQKTEDVNTGLLTGPEDIWQMSLLIFICHQVARNADQDIKKLLEAHKRRHENP